MLTNCSLTNLFLNFELLIPSWQHRDKIRQSHQEIRKTINGLDYATAIATV